MTKIGILALQGAFVEHLNMFSKLGVQVALIKSPLDLLDLGKYLISSL